MTSSNYNIEIADEQTKPFDDKPLISAVQKILTNHQILQAEISIAIVDDPTIRKLNYRYLDHDFETDVISFVLEYDEDSSFLSGQLIVSTDTAANMAEQVGGTMQDEMLLYVIHGTLHLVGFDDVDPADAAEMRKSESKYLATFGVEHRWLDDEQDTDDRGVFSP